MAEDRREMEELLARLGPERLAVELLEGRVPEHREARAAIESAARTGGWGIAAPRWWFTSRSSTSCASGTGRDLGA